jgi:PAS domain S-box-containing protein
VSQIRASKSRGVTERTRKTWPRRGSGKANSQREGKFFVLFQKAPFPAALTRLSDRTFVDVNEAFERMSGFTKAEVVGKTSFELGIVSDPAPGVLIREELVKKGFIRNREMRARDKFGREYTVLANIEVVEIDGEKYTLATTQDVTERKRAEDALRESEQRLRLFIEYAPAAIAMFDRDMRYLAASNRWKQDYHLDGQIVGRSHYEVFPEIPERWKEIHRRSLAGEILTAEEDPFPRGDGTIQWIKWETRPWRLADGEIGGVLIAAEDITSRVLSKEAIRRSEEQLALISNAVPALISYIDRDCRYRFCNQAYQQWFGIPQQQILGRTMLEVLGETAWRTMEPRVRSALAGNLEQFEAEAEYAYGGTRWIKVTYTPHRNQHADVVGLVVMVLDITEEKRAALALQESEDRFRALGENIAQLAWMADENGWIFWYNRRWYEYTGTDYEQMQGWGWEKVHHPGELQRMLPTWRKALETGKPWEDIFPLRRFDGEYCWFLSRAFPLRNAEGKITRWFGTNTDITDLRQAQGALAERENVLRTVTNEARVGLVMVDQDRRYLFANQTYADILGLPDANIVGKRVPDVLAHLYSQIKPRLDRAFAGERTTYELQLAQHPRSSEERFYEVVYEPRVDHVSEPYVIVVLSDITERKRVEQRLEKLVAERTARLTETVGELEAFSYTIAHDMRAPLRAMQSFATILTLDYMEKLDDNGKQLLARIGLSASRLDHLIQDVLNYSKIVGSDLRLEPLDPQSLLEEIIHSYPNLQPSAADITISGPLPPLLGNRAALTQVFSNLLGNAVKFVPPGVRPRVVIRAESERPGIAVSEPSITTSLVHPSSAPTLHHSTTPIGASVRLWFEDNGIGIGRDAQKRLFQMFQRVHHPGLYDGTGMGLAIVRKAVERMGGRVGVESEPGKGSRFWLELKQADSL